MPVRKYQTTEGTVLWNSEKCIHSANCVNGLPEVFRPKESPWIDVSAAEASRIVAQVRQCPSGALSIEEDATMQEPVEVKLAEDGPLLIKGQILISYPDGSTETKEKCALCRCGASENKPFCDGTHKKVGFKADR